jgi:membrane fusion protein (multidrug efflux system)
MKRPYPYCPLPLGAELPNPRAQLRPGQSVRVVLSGAMRPDAIAVAQRAVRDGPTGKSVYLVNTGNKAEVRPVERGECRGQDWIVHSGLKAGDRVIVDGLLKIGPGAPVRVAAPADRGAPPGRDRR